MPSTSSLLALLGSSTASLSFPSGSYVTLNSINSAMSLSSGQTASYELFSLADGTTVTQIRVGQRIERERPSTATAASIQLGLNFGPRYSYSLVDDATAKGIFLDISNRSPPP